jgi:hypothetical protein
MGTDGTSSLGVIQELADRVHEPLNDKASHRLREFSYTCDKRICGD